MKKVWLVIAVVIGLTSMICAHDEGHGPKLTDNGKYGGVIAPVLLAKEAPLGRKATLIYKAELTRAQDGTFYVYLYDAHMKPLSLAKFEATGYAHLEIKKKKVWHTTKISLEKKGPYFSGKLPEIARKPFNLDIFIKEGGKELLIAFDNLD